MKDNWISVDDRLPDNEDMVFIYPEPDFDESGRIVLAYYSQYDGGTNGVKKNKWYCFDRSGYEFERDYVTYWMPLPACPNKPKECA